MKHEIDLNKYNIRTDLILESIENNNNKIDTITENHDGILVTSVNVDDKSSSLLNKEKGKYTTILFEDATDSTNASKIEEVLISVLTLTAVSTVSALVGGICRNTQNKAVADIKESSSQTYRLVRNQSRGK